MRNWSSATTNPADDNASAASRAAGDVPHRVGPEEQQGMELPSASPSRMPDAVAPDPSGRDPQPAANSEAAGEEASSRPGSRPGANPMSSAP